MMELKPCPFCGENVKVVRTQGTMFYEGVYMIVCDKCGMLISNKVKDTRKYLVEMWNRRAYGD